MSRLFLGAAVLFLTAAPALTGQNDVRVIVGFKGQVDPAALGDLGGTTGRVLANSNAVAMTLPAGAVARLRANALIAFVEEDGIVEATGQGQGKAKAAGKGNGKKPPKEPDPDPGTDPVPPPDTDDVVEWGVDRVGGPRSVSGIKVAIIDTGIDLYHPDLAANIVGNTNIIRPSKSGDDDNGHGSHCAGTVAAADNSEGGIGIAHDASLYAIKVLDRRGYGFWSDVAAGIDHAVAEGAQIANMSLGGGYSTAVKDACDAAEGAGVLLVASSGNYGTGYIGYPAYFDSVVSVGATDINNNLASFSATNDHVELVGPGVAVRSAWKNGGYLTADGTSMAAPHAAGCAAVIWGSFGNAASVRTALQDRAIDLTDDGQDRDNAFGYGLVQH